MTSTEDGPTERTLTFVIDEDDVPNLAVLAPPWSIATDDEQRAREVLQQLCERIDDGIRRPGSWERRWLEQAFGDDWIARLESDPDYPYRQRPKASAGPVPTGGEGTPP